MERQAASDKQQTTPPAVGVTGGVATGKSSVMRLFAERGAVCFSADQAARAVVSPHSPVLAQIVQAFGAAILLPTGELDRSGLAQRVFGDAQARETLNQITHPPILRLLRAQIDACRVDLPPDTLVVVEVPLLFETRLQTWFERIIVVTASLEVQTARLRARDRLDDGEARRRINAQMPLAHKAALADHVIENEGVWPDLTRAVDALWRELQTIRR